MFYAHIVLAKKGPLARIWLAAHWDKKLTKAHVFETNIEKSVEGIMQPKVKLALRTSGHLLLGVVRIYSRKAKYLLADCNEAFIKIKMAFRPGIVDLPEGHREANVNTITLPEVFHDFDTALPELNDVDIEAQFSINQSRADEITMREDYGSLSLSLHDDGFGDIGFDADTPDLARDYIDPNLDEHLLAEEVCESDAEVKAQAIKASQDVVEDVSDVDGFGDEFGHPDVGLFEGDMFGELAVAEDKSLHAEDNKTDDEEDYGKMSPTKSVNYQDSHLLPTTGSSSSAANQIIRKSPVCIEEGGNDSNHHNADEINLLKQNKEKAANDNQQIALKEDQSSQIPNEEESFALAPVDASAYKGVTKAKRKRKLIVDDIKNISGEEMKAQLSNTSDIVTTLDLAPPTKRLMYWKETGGVEKLFSLPSRDIPARGLFLNYQRNLISRLGLLEDFSILGPLDVLALDQLQQDFVSPSSAPNKRGRKRKNIDYTTPAHNNEIASSNFGIESDVGEFAEPDTVRNIGSNSNDNTCQNLETPHIGVPPQTMDTFALLQNSDGVFSIPDLEPIAPIESVGMAPENLQNDLDIQDDFHHSSLTPHHPGIENIESIPNLPIDQVSSILNEAENMPGDLVDGKSLNINGMDNAPLSASDWNEYDFPQSVEIQSCDQQQENETDEQFEERVLNKRAAQMFISVRGLLQKENSILLCGITRGNSRKQAAQKFYSLLVLKKFRALNITQTASYTDIVITKGPAFDNPKL